MPVPFANRTGSERLQAGRQMWAKTLPEWTVIFNHTVIWKEWWWKWKLGQEMNEMKVVFYFAVPDVYATRWWWCWWWSHAAEGEADADVKWSKMERKSADGGVVRSVQSTKHHESPSRFSQPGWRDTNLHLLAEFLPAKADSRPGVFEANLMPNPFRRHSNLTRSEDVGRSTGQSVAGGKILMNFEHQTAPPPKTFETVMEATAKDRPYMLVLVSRCPFFTLSILSVVSLKHYFATLLAWFFDARMVLKNFLIPVLITVRGGY